MRVTATILFILSGIVAVAVAPNPVGALDQFALLALGLAAAWVLAWLARVGGAMPVLGTVGLLCAWLAAALGVLFVLTYDWSATAGGASPVQQLGLALQAARPAFALPPLLADAINENVLASGLVVLLPLGAGGVAWVLRRGRNRIVRWLVAGLTLLALALAGFVLLLTFSRGGWLGLGVGAVCGGWLAIRPYFRLRPILMYAGDAAAIVLPALLVGLFFLALLAPEASGPLGSSTVAGSSGSRASLWQDALTLVGDYRFTGSGYGSTMMVLSTYIYLLHVGFIPHVHNLYLEIAVEQGLVGLIAFLFLAGTAGWNLVQAFRLPTLPQGLAGAATAALVALLLHGLVDAGLYVSKLAPLLFLPMGFAWGMAPQARRTSFSWERFAQRTAVALAPLLVVLVLFAWPGARGAFQANLGAVSQTRAELARYTWPEWPIQDSLRRNPGVDLDPAIARYAAALGYDGGNVTASRRLGQIALARGEYETARRFLEEAYVRAPEQRATRLLLGEIYAIFGRLDDAATLWRTVDTSFGQLDGREWWLTQVGTPEQIDSFREARKRLVPG